MTDKEHGKIISRLQEIKEIDERIMKIDTKIYELKNNLNMLNRLEDITISFNGYYIYDEDFHNYDGITLKEDEVAYIVKSTKNYLKDRIEMHEMLKDNQYELLRKVIG